MKDFKNKDDLKNFLDEQAAFYNQPSFIADDPISIPHLFTKQQDIEIIGFWVAILAWGQRKNIIKKAKELIKLMDNAPYEFIKNHKESDLTPFLDFKYRTFNATDTLYFLRFFKYFYTKYKSLEEAFLIDFSKNDENVEQSLKNFHKLFFSLDDAPERTRKHIATPAKYSACKRINMFLRWMVRKDEKGVDFGIWKKISPSQLICPCDVHVARVATKLGLIQRKQINWKTAVELSKKLKSYDPKDPVKYDFALFGLGVSKIL